MVTGLRTLQRQVTCGAKGRVAGNVNCILIGWEDERIEQEARLVRSLGNYLCARVHSTSVKNNDVSFVNKFHVKFVIKQTIMIIGLKIRGTTCKKTNIFLSNRAVINIYRNFM